MDDAQYAFYQDIKSRKQMLSGARGLKRGSRSKTCTLSSDYMTKGQLKKMNGEVKVYKMNSPMSWSEFKSMPAEHQEAYLKHLMNKFGVTYVQLGEMFGTSNTNIYQYVKKHNFRSVIDIKNSKRMNTEQLHLWYKFCHPVEFVESQVYSEESNTEDTSSPAVSPMLECSNLQGITLNFDGHINFKNAISYFQKIIGESATGHLQISFSSSK